MGDRVLTGLATRLREGTRPSDHVARMGGEEFLVFLPQTELPSAQAAAEDSAFDNLLIRADRALYAAKSAGRNRVHLADPFVDEVTSLATA